MTQLTLYTRDGCHLCEDAKIQLELLRMDIPFELTEINIDESEELTEKFGLCIPVVEYEGEIIQYGQIVAEEVKVCLISKKIVHNS